ncbi:MAG: hypothetical protein MUD08_09055 [Cytophagales bacterium]|nr:hypothetical protein [Cytophagales bacterium]
MRKITFSLLAVLCACSFAFGQEEKKATFSVTMNQDSFFGFYPAISGAYQMSDKVEWTFYGIFWTTPSFGTGGGGGLWTEFGTGVNLSLAEGKLKLNPQVGILNGRLLSNGDFPMFLEGVVPSLTANLSTDRLEGQLYAGYYAALRTGQRRRSDADPTLVDAPSRNNFLHWWINAGYKVTPAFSFGGHFEHLRSNPSEGESSNLYQWVGPYVQASIPSKGITVRFTGGADITDRPATDGTSSFYKLSATFGF